MVVPISNSKNYVICPFCGSPELISSLSGEEANNENRTCTYCGQMINTNNNRRKKERGTNLLENFYFEMRFVTYREIYHILKNTILLDTNVKSLDLTEFEISKIVDQVRRKTINGSFLVDLKEKFPRGQFPQVRRLYQEIRVEQQQEQLFNDEYRILFEEATMDLFSIICGDKNYHDLTDIQKRIVTNIIQEEGFNPEDKDDNYSFNQQAWLLAAFHIHHILTEREKVSYSNLKLILSPIRINEIAQEFTDFFTGDLMLEKWDWKAIMLKKTRFEKELRSLQLNLKVDWIFRESFVTQAKRLIMFISQLIRGEININLVKDLEKKIADQLIYDLNIDNNSRISSIFKFNFMLVITRLVYFTLRTYPEGPPLGENLMESEEPIEQKITWHVKKEMLNSESINESILKNLHEMEITDFNEAFSTIKRNLENDFMFSMSFNGYLESIIKQVITLISTTKKKSRHSLDELAIIENLANYNFQWKEREITDEEVDEEVDDDVIEKEYLRTYKVGLRAPESLFTKQNKLAIELEVLQHVRKELRGNKSTLFETKLSNCSKKIWQEYTRAQDKYSFVNTNKKALVEALKVKNSLKQLHWKNSRLNSDQFTKKELPSFKDIAAPQVSEISLTDYQALASKSLKMLCTHLNEHVLNQVDKIPRNKHDFLNLAFQNSQREGKGYTESQIRNRFEIALANITGIHSNTGRTAFYQLGMALKGYFDLREKVEHVCRLIGPLGASNGDFSGEIPVLLGFYSIPNNLRRYVANSWKVDSGWVRNTLVGWRRKMDPYLPVEFQIEPLTEKFMKLAMKYTQYARNDKDVKVIGKLQKKYVLHLLSNHQIDLRTLLPRDLHESYAYLQNKIKVEPKLLAPHVHSIDLTEFLNAADKLIESVQETQSRFPSSSQPYENCKTFINKIKFIKIEASKKEFQEILNNHILGNQFTSNVARLLANNSTYKRLFTAMRGIVALTLAKKHPSAIGQFLSTFTPENCVTFPFKSTRRVASRLPVNLLFNKYIVERKAHPASSDYLVNQSSRLKSNMTEIFQNGEPIWLGLPIYSPHQGRQFHKVVLGQRKSVGKLGTFWFQVIPSKKIVNCLRRGAEVRDIRLNVPKGPTNKIVADIVLSSRDPSSFQHGGNFLKAWDDDFDNVFLPFHEFLGSDINRIGKYMVATANPDEEHDLSKMMHRYENVHERLEKMRRVEIPRIQAKLSLDKDGFGGQIPAPKRGRLMTQLTLLHQKREKLMTEMKLHALMIYLYVAWKTKAKYVGWDSIGGISTRGKRGALAQAITYLPKRKVLYDEFRHWASDLKVQGFLPHYESTIPVSPYNSQACSECFQQTGTQEHSRDKDIPYDEFSCKKCGRNSQTDPVINRHSNSARVSAILLQNHVHVQQASSS